VIHVRDLHKTYRRAKVERSVLRGVNLDIAPGQICALLGRSGSGKSTLLHILGGLDNRFDGAVEVAQTRLGNLSDPVLAAFRRERVGFMFQDFHLLDHLDVISNVMLSARFDSRDTRSRLFKTAKDLLAQVGLASRSADSPADLSGGERQRVALARALLRSPQVLLADEPTGNLDRDTGLSLLNLLSETARERQSAVVIVTHDMQVAERADQRFFLHDGQLQESPVSACDEDVS